MSNVGKHGRMLRFELELEGILLALFTKRDESTTPPVMRTLLFRLWFLTTILH